MDGRSPLRRAMLHACLPLRSFLAPLVLAVVVSGAGPPVAAAAPAALPPQGVYDECAPAQVADGCAGELDRIAGAGFGLMLNYTQWRASPAQVVANAQRAATDGIQIIWPLSDPVWRRGGNLKKTYPELSQACACDDLLAYVIGLVKDQPGTWGYYVGDEVAVAELPAVLALQARVKALDPNHPTLYVTYENMASVGKNLTPFTGAGDVIGAATYPVGTIQEIGYTKQVAALTSRLAKAANRQTAVVVQSFDWNQYPGASPNATGGFPTRTQMQQQRDAALDGPAPSMLLWYSLYDIDRSADPAGSWADLVAAAFAPAPGTKAAQPAAGPSPLASPALPAPPAPSVATARKPPAKPTVVTSASAKRAAARKAAAKRAVTARRAAARRVAQRRAVQRGGSSASQA